ncbi:MAG: PTS ascorbate transporter subunit IIC [Firmicutes bacterium]|nr:PTS ascorbate transporter subunit IIC [Bacillota bacterium]
MAFLDFFINQVLRQPANFLGLIVLIGCILQGKGAKDSIVATVKTIVGVKVLQLGSGTLVSASKPIMEALTKAYNIRGVVMDPWTHVGEAMQRMPKDIVANVGLIMVAGWLLHLLFAKLSPIKVVYLTGHVAFSDTVCLTWFVYECMRLDGTAAIAVSTLICAIYWWFFPSLIYPYLKKFIGDTPITLGHNLCISGIITTYLARVGNPDDSAENLKLPGWLSMFGDSVVAYGLVMAVLYFALTAFIGPAALAKDAAAAGQNYLFYGAMQGVQIAVGITVLLMGVRMFLAELLPAFKGFADKVIPGAIAAVDNPVFWPYAPTAALLGFVATVVAQLVALGLLVAFKSPIIAIPSVIPLFFGGCTLGVFANAYGGWKGVLFACSVMGFVNVFGSAALAAVGNLSVGVAGHTDYSTIWLAFFGLMRAIFGGR